MKYLFSSISSNKCVSNIYDMYKLSNCYKEYINLILGSNIFNYTLPTF